MEQIKEIRSYIDTMGVYMSITDKDENGVMLSEPIISINIDNIKIGEIKMKEFLEWFNFWLPSFWLPQII